MLLSQTSSKIQELLQMLVPHLDDYALILCRLFFKIQLLHEVIVDIHQSQLSFWLDEPFCPQKISDVQRPKLETFLEFEVGPRSTILIFATSKIHFCSETELYLSLGQLQFSIHQSCMRGTRNMQTFFSSSPFVQEEIDPKVSLQQLVDQKSEWRLKSVFNNFCKRFCAVLSVCLG